MDRNFEKKANVFRTTRHARFARQLKYYYRKHQIAIHALASVDLFHQKGNLLQHRITRIIRRIHNVFRKDSPPINFLCLKMYNFMNYCVWFDREVNHEGKTSP